MGQLDHSRRLAQVARLTMIAVRSNGLTPGRFALLRLKGFSSWPASDSFTNPEPASYPRCVLDNTQLDERKK